MNEMEEAINKCKKEADMKLVNELKTIVGKKHTIDFEVLGK